VKKKNEGGYHLCDLWGIYYADYLLSIGNEVSIKLADCITQDNIKYARRNRLTEIESQCNRVLGDINCWRVDNKTKDKKFLYDTSETNYEEALFIANKTSHRPVIIEALLGLGRFKIKTMQVDEARKCLNDANKLCYADSDSESTPEYYKFYEVDICIALAMTYSMKEKEAKELIEYARGISDKINYKIGRCQSISLLTKYGLL